MQQSKAARMGAAAGITTAIAGAFVAGALMLGSANAAQSSSGTSTTPSTSQSQSQLPPGPPGGNRDQSQPQRSDEKLLTGTDAAKARAAALGKYPGASIQRVETDSDGVYEAHLTTKDGKFVTVEMDKNFKVTGTEQGPR